MPRHFDLKLRTMTKLHVLAAWMNEVVWLISIQVVSIFINICNNWVYSTMYETVHSSFFCDCLPKHATPIVWVLECELIICPYRSSCWWRPINLSEGVRVRTCVRQEDFDIDLWSTWWYLHLIIAKGMKLCSLEGRLLWRWQWVVCVWVGGDLSVHFIVNTFPEKTVLWLLLFSACNNCCTKCRRGLRAVDCPTSKFTLLLLWYIRVLALADR